MINSHPHAYDLDSPVNVCSFYVLFLVFGFYAIYIYGNSLFWLDTFGSF